MGFAHLRLRTRTATCILLAAIVLSGGCSTEFRNDGGFIANIEDQVVKAPNRQWQTYRAAFFLALISSVAEADLKDVNSVLSFYRAASAVNDNINDLAGHIYPQSTWYTYNITFKPTDMQHPSVGSWHTPDGKISGATDATQKPKAQPISPALLPCPNYASQSGAKTGCGDRVGSTADNPYRFGNYVGLFDADLPTSNDHMFKAAAAAIRQDKFLKLLQDGSKGSPLFGPAGIWLGLLQDLGAVLGEAVDSETHLAATWRSEADNSASISTISRPGSPPFPCKADEPTTGTDWTRNCILRTTTQNALSVTTTPTVDTPIDMKAFEPLYASIRKSCRALRDKLPAPSKDPLPLGTAPQPDKTMIDCSVFALSPNVYRAQYQKEPD